MWEEVEVLETHTNFRADLVDVLHIGGQQGPVDCDGSLLMLLQSIDAADEGGFSRAGRPANHNPLATLHIEIDVAQHMERAIPFIHVLD